MLREIVESVADIDYQYEVVAGLYPLKSQGEKIRRQYFIDNFLNTEKYSPDEDDWYYVDKYMDEEDVQNLFKKISKFIK
jgi:N-glycosylase/DNA lyase